MKNEKNPRINGTLSIGEGEEAFSFIDVFSQKFKTLNWRLRYAQDSLTAADKFYAAQVFESLSHMLLQRDWVGKVYSRKYLDLVADATLALGVEEDPAE